MLIDAIVRQTTVLIAQLATTGGSRAQLAHTANQVFVDLVASLKEQGLGSKVIADMFGLALRTYHSKLQRLTESQTVSGRTLWQALFDYVQSQRVVYRSDVLRRFANDDPISVRGVLKDLVDSGVLSRSGRGDQTRYQVALDVSGSASHNDERTAHLVALTVHRLGPASRDDLIGALSLDSHRLERALAELVADGRVRVVTGDVERFASDGCVLPIEDAHGWEAALFDHYQAMVSAMCTKLRLGQTHAEASDLIGGSTFSYQVWPGHPHYVEATRFLSDFRSRGSTLRRKIAEHNRSHTAPTEGVSRVIIYGGQTLFGVEDADGLENTDD